MLQCESLRNSGVNSTHNMQHFEKDWVTYDVHMEGVRTIIKLKGGIHAINHNRILRLLLSGYGYDLHSNRSHD